VAFGGKAEVGLDEGEEALFGVIVVVDGDERGAEKASPLPTGSG
jgi:hypothetical protein